MQCASVLNIIFVCTYRTQREAGTWMLDTTRKFYYIRIHWKKKKESIVLFLNFFFKITLHVC